jgi:hypothetical protein
MNWEIYIFLSYIKKYLKLQIQHTRVYFERTVTYTLPSGVSGFTLKGQWHILSGHVFLDLLWKDSDIYSPVMCFGIYFERQVIYTPPSCVSGFTLKGQRHMLSRHVFRDLLWKTSDIYSPVMCFGIYFVRPVIYTLPSCGSGFTL